MCEYIAYFCIFFVCLYCDPLFQHTKHSNEALKFRDLSREELLSELKSWKLEFTMNNAANLHEFGIPKSLISRPSTASGLMAQDSFHIESVGTINFEG